MPNKTALQPRGTRTKRRLRAFRDASRARRAVAVLHNDPPAPGPAYSILDDLRALAAEPRDGR